MPENKTQHSLNKGMIKDINDSQVSGEYYTHARNAVTNSHDGQSELIQNEPSNLHCVTLPYTHIGSIPTEDNQWVVFSTNNTESEIGLFNDSTCTYRTIINQACLGFNVNHPITGVSRRTFDCSVKVYWSDGLNPDRALDITNPPYIKTRTLVGSCWEETVTNQVDCEKLRIIPLVDIPCLSLSRSKGSGLLPNGSYQVAVAYAINEIRVTDYLITSNPIAIWDHGNVAGALELSVSETDGDYDEMEIVLIATINGQTKAVRLGIYSTRQGIVHINSIEESLPVIPLSLIPLQTPAIEKSDAIYGVGPYLLRTGVYTKADFNYQPLANQIKTKWVSARYPSDYYKKFGKNAGYMRDEVYTFFIRWVHNTGEKSASYHIPCNVFGPPGGYTYAAGSTGDGGTFVTEGYTEPYLSTERYPDNRPDIWGSLCGEQYRHHKFPDNNTDNHFEPGGEYIRVLGVKFENIKVPVDNSGTPISSIIGYEILRGSREGNKSIIAKGMIKNMRSYNLPGGGIGLYQNYPYNDLRVNRTTIHNERTGAGLVTTTFPNTDGYLINNITNSVSRNFLSFHSPDTTFTHPYLPGSSYLRVYEDIVGYSRGTFLKPYQHPEFKILGPGAEVLAGIVSGISTTSTTMAGALGFDMKLTGTEDLPFQYPLTVNPSIPADVFGAVTVETSPMTWIMTAILISANATVLGMTAALRYGVTREQLLRVMTSLVAPKQFARQYNSYGFFNNYYPNSQNLGIANMGYVKGQIQGFGNYRINNLFRNDYVAIECVNNLSDPSVTDTSRFTIGERGCDAPLSQGYTESISAKYGAIKISDSSLYGQLDSIRQIPISTCLAKTEPNILYVYSSPVYFGGDTYINRYTEKNPFTFFNDWLLGQPADYPYDYRNSINIPNPLYWVDNRKVYTDFFNLVADYRQLECEGYSAPPGGQSTIDYNGTGSASGGGFNPINMSDYSRTVQNLTRLGVTQGQFYLSCNGVHDFFVESDVNLAFRDWEDDASKRFYDPYGYTDINEMFRSDIIKSPGYYKYDYSLSVSKLYSQYVSWGSVLPRDFDPIKAETCYDYYPRRVIYSLPQTEELKKDNWQSFLANNYKDFLSKVTAIKQIGRSGALIMLDKESPMNLVGVDTLQTDAGIKVTVGDGGLFNQPLQSIVNSDKSYEYGSCQNKYGVIATPQGVFWVSQDQGKIFNYSSGLEEISASGLRWWFSRYLPSQLKKAFPEFPYTDNPVAGCGIIMGYDNTNNILYITKKDYKPLSANISYRDGIGFIYDNNGVSHGVDLCDSTYFEDVSWTISYDTKYKKWVSFHDWHPNFMLPGNNHFLTSFLPCTGGQSGLWKHNVRCDSFCNFYGYDRPFELEFVSSYGEMVTSLRNVEYQMECIRYKLDCSDKFHVLDFNFDQAIIHNSEQISGLLKLNLKDKKDPFSNTTYPSVNPNYIDILYSKEEQKYRFNQFWDITKDRGEFSGAQVSMFETQGNGYIRAINPAYVDYYKELTERKKFRNTSNRVFLSKLVSDNTKMIFKLANVPVQPSKR